MGRRTWWPMRWSLRYRHCCVQDGREITTQVGLNSERVVGHPRGGVRPFTAEIYSQPRKGDVEGFCNVDDKKVWLVFDVNGTLASRTKVRKYRAGQRMQPDKWLKPRPYVDEFLKSLHSSGHFNLAIWSSAKRHNVVRSVELLEAISGIRFDMVLSRQDTSPRPEPRKTPWDTVKPLYEKGFRDLRRVLLVDDEREKAHRGEESNLVVIPSWCENDDDNVLKILGRGLLDLVPHVDDVRLVSKKLSDLVVGHEGNPLPVEKW